MSTHRYIDRICVALILFAIVITTVFMNGESLGVLPVLGGTGYANRLFDTSKVHTIDIVMEDWEGFIENCEKEEYEECAVVIDGEAFKNVGIRAKGNTSLSSVSAMGSERYSFKVEFDHYDSTKSYFGLDKISLNNLIQDTTFMKDYLVYQMMGSFGVAAPLCSYAYITVNGKEWGLYLAVEGVEESFLQRNYGNDYGNLYKPDSVSMGAGPGNGRDFRMDEFMEFPGEDGSGEMPEIGGFPGKRGLPAGGEDWETEDFPPGGEPSEMGRPPENRNIPEGGPEEGKDMPDGPGGSPGGFPGGMGSSDVKLQYLGDDPGSYSNIFDNAKTEIGKADQERLISSLKSLSEGSGIEEVVDVDAVIRYFVVHNFVCNGDSYTGSIVHNYYLYEKDGQLSMIPWDYNLAFGTFEAADATAMVNAPIDTPVSQGREGNFPFGGQQNQAAQEKEAAMDGGDGKDSRPMVEWIFADEAYTRQYHQYFADFLESINFEEIIHTTAELIGPYAEKDPTKFYTYEEFETGVAALEEFCRLRKESVEGQLCGRIASTSAGQGADGAVLVDASHLSLTDMGTMERGEGKSFAVSPDILYNNSKP